MVMSTSLDPATERLARHLFRGLRQTLLNRGLYQQTKAGIREVSWLGWAYWPESRAVCFVVDTGRLPVTIEKLADERVIHQVSTALGGRPVRITNSRGLAFIVGIDAPEPQAVRRLPSMVELDLGQWPEAGSQGPAYPLALGLGRNGPLWLDLEHACHIMIGGSADSGKSACLRSLLYQLMVMPEPVEVALVDMEGRTFSAFEGLPRVRFPVAGDVEGATRITAWLMAEMDRRSRLFDATARHPEKLAEYHACPGVERLPWLVAVFDEFSALLDDAGQRSDLYRHLGQLAMRSRKYGVTLVFAGQDFKSDLINSRITNQVRTRIAHRCATRYQSESILGQAGAERLVTQGRALASIHGRIEEVQGYWVPKDWILALHERGTGGRGGLTESERRAFGWALDSQGGYLGITDIMAVLGLSEWKARRQAEAWEQAGLMEKDPVASNKRRISQTARELLAGFEGRIEGPAAGIEAA
jgi:hypothetical protein